MQLYCEGKAAAFEELYRRYSKRLLYFIYRMVSHDEAKAQDILQDVFLKLADQPYLFDVGKTFKPWVFTIAANAARKSYRGIETTVVEEAHFNTINQPASVDAVLDHKVFKRALRLELNQLKPGHKAVFVLRYQEQFSVKEISQVLAISEGTVKSRLHYVTKHLADKLEVFNPINK